MKMQYMLLFYFCGWVGVGGGIVRKSRLKLTSAKVKVEVEAELDIVRFQESPFRRQLKDPQNSKLFYAL